MSSPAQPRLLAVLRLVLAGLAYVAVLAMALVHQAPQRSVNPGEFEPLSYHPYVIHPAVDGAPVKATDQAS